MTASGALELHASPGFAEWLSQQAVSLAATSPDAGKLLLIGCGPNGRLRVFERTFRHCHGLGADGGGNTLYLSSRYQVWRLENALAPGQRHQDHDRLYVPRFASTTGFLDVHDLDADRGDILFVATRFDCLARISEAFSFAPAWRPPFVSRLSGDDRCHLTGVACAPSRRAGKDDSSPRREPRFVTCAAQSDTPLGWRERRRDGGCVLDVRSGASLLGGLSLPHSPRLHDELLWVLDSGRGALLRVDPDRGSTETVAMAPGFLRGLTFTGSFAVVGLSAPEAGLSGLEVGERLAREGTAPRCALGVLDLARGEWVHWLQFSTGVRELASVAVLPGVGRPMALGLGSDEIRRVITIDPAGSPAIHGVSAAPIAVPPPSSGGRRRPVKDDARPPSGAAASTPAVLDDEGYHRALRALAERRIEEAERHLRAVLERLPSDPDAHYALGEALRIGGRVDEAAIHFERSLELRPANASAWNALGLCSFARGDLDRAVAAYRRALDERPEYARAANNLGQALMTKGERRAAIDAFRDALRRDPDYAIAHNNLGAALNAERRPVEAASHLRRALELEPDYPEAHYNLGEALRAVDDPGAGACLRRAIELRPGYGRAHSALGRLLTERDELDEALASLRTALEHEPDLAEAHNNLAVALQAKGERASAEAHYRRALELDIPFPEVVHNNLGCLLQARGERDRALEHFHRSIECRGDYAEAHHNLAAALLAEGDLAAGFDEFRWRASRLEHYCFPQPASEPPRRFSDDLRGRTILLEGEMGLGDELLFLRFARGLHQRGARLRLRCGSKLYALLRRHPWLEAVYTREEQAPPADDRRLVCDLPAALGAATVADIPPPVELTVGARIVAAARRRLTSFGPPPYVALTWWAGTKPAIGRKANAAYRELPLEELARALAPISATFVAVQRIPARGELERLEELLRRPLHDLSALNDDLEEMLALLSVVDEYVGISNTNMHLIAGIGRPCRVLVPSPAEWLYRASGETTPWFPGFRLYRQVLDDWSEAVESLRADLVTRYGGEAAK